MKTYLLSFFCFISVSVLGQGYGNDWVVPGQAYYKVRVWEQGIHRITGSQLLSAGVPTGADPRSLQLFRHGREQAIRVEGEGDGRLDGADYLEFFGQPNDGIRDTLLYPSAKERTNPYVALHSDTTFYFVTLRANGTGKRMVSPTIGTTAGLVQEPYHLEEQLMTFSGGYSFGPNYPMGARLFQAATMSHYERGDGYMDSRFGTGGVRDYSIPIQNAVTTGPQPILETSIYGVTPDLHKVYYNVGSSSASVRRVLDLSFLAYDLRQVNLPISWSDCSPNNIILQLGSVSGISGETIATVHHKLTYAQNFALPASGGKRFNLRENPVGRSWVLLNSKPEGIYLITNPDAVERVSGSTSGGQTDLLIDNTQRPQRLWVSKSAKVISKIERVIFRQLPTSATYLIVTNRRLQKPVGSVADPVRAYAGYRSTPAGGGYDTLVVHIDEIADQFNYGERNALAIREFARYMLGVGQPKHLFLVGAAVFPQVVRQQSDFYDHCLVPIGGWPPSDWVTVNGLGGAAKNVPALSVGRLQAKQPEVVLNYLNKVRDFEAEAPGLWRKSLLNLSGGKTAGEQDLFRSYHQGFKRIAETGVIGAKANILSKKTDEPVEYFNITGEANRGLGMITFFGHAGSNVTDIDIGYVSNDILGYRNKGKYPLVLINGCEAGDAFGYKRAEAICTDWVNTPDRGAVLFLASTYAGFPSYLDALTTTFYKEALGKESGINQPMGTLVARTTNEYLKLYSDEMAIGHSQQFALMGDPAIVPFPLPKPDYAIENTGLFVRSFNGGSVTASADSFQLGMVVSNIGRVPSGKFGINVKRTLSDGSVENLGTRSYNAVSFKDTLFLTIKNTPNGSGNNGFEVRLDPDNAFDEINENNNVGNLAVSLQGTYFRPIFPREFGIVGSTDGNQPSVDILAEFSPANITTTFPKALIELDTSATFNSPFKRIINDISGNTTDPAYRVKVPLLAADSTVYFWRIRNGSIPEGFDNQWVTRSFTYIKGIVEGWSQGKIPQLDKNAKEQAILTASGWKFNDNSVKIGLTVRGLSAQSNAFRAATLSLNNIATVFNGNCNNNSLVAVAFQKTSVLPYSIQPAQLCGSALFAANSFTAAQINDGTFEAYLDAVPNGNFVMLFPSGGVNPSVWPAQIRTKVAALGADATQLANLRAGHPFVLLARKGTGQPILWRVPPTVASGDTLTMKISDFELRDEATNATVTSSFIGPATRWGTLSQQILRNQPAQQSATLDVIGISPQGTETVLFSNFSGASLDISSIDTRRFPILKLRQKLNNNTFFGAIPQLTRWTVTHDALPEGVALTEASPRQYRSMFPMNAAEGESFQLPVRWHVYPGSTFRDSVLVRQTLITPISRQRIVKTFKLPTGLPVVFNGVQNPKLLETGQHTVTLEFNPQAQPEANYSNNTVSFLVNVLPDGVPPMLEVAFDGKTIQDGDVVSANPEVTVRLLDESTNFRKDTLGIDLAWQSPGMPGLRKLAFSNPQMQWRVLPNTNDFRATYRPKNLPDGTYRFQVLARDAAGNLAGGLPYNISFKVMNAVGIQQFFPNPNPLHFFTRFTLVLSGSEVPDDFGIDIFTLDGRKVSAISAENQDLTLGRNEYLWNGNSTDGQPLPSGMYIYKLRLNLRGEAYPMLNTTQKTSGRIMVIR